MSDAAIYAPAGSFGSLNAAFQAGADAVYFGVGRWNMRAGAAANFTPDDLPAVAAACHEHGAKAVLAVNTILYDDELAGIRELCSRAKECGVDACIAGDPAVLAWLRKIGMSAHITVQCNISNLEAVRFYAPYADVMVLARELSLEQIRRITEGIREQNIRGPSGELVRTEVFVHGACCIALSGRCGMSLYASGRSSNRGECLQNCRRRYVVRDAETGVEMEIDNEFVMSPKDICTIGFLDRILESGVSVLKIEGRGRPADYVRETVSVYREARDCVRAGTYGPEKIAGWKKRLASVFNRGFWEGGWYLGEFRDMWSGCGGSQATRTKEYIGRVTNWYSKLSVACVRMDAGILREGDRLLVTGPSTGACELCAEGLRVDDRAVEEARRGMEVTFRSPVRLRTGDQVQILKDKVKNS